ncbi:MAG: hypothetical protein ACFFDF_08045 [Candidatus Odinarchaeota archaeon]
MGIKSEKKKLIELRGEISKAPEFIENLNDHNQFSKASKKVIKNILEQKKTEFEIIGSSKHDQYMRACLAQFQSNITYSDIYKKCVLEVNDNTKNIKMINQFAEIRDSHNKKKRKK